MSKSLRLPIFFAFLARLFVLLSVLALSSSPPLPVCQMLALAVLDRILSIDRQNQWLVYVCNSGYLRSLVESLRQDDAALQSLLTPQPPLLKPLYIYESKMVRGCALKQTHNVLHWFFQSLHKPHRTSSLCLKPVQLQDYEGTNSCCVFSGSADSCG